MKKKKILLILLFVSCSIAFAGGGWPQPKKHGYIKLGQYVLDANRFFNPAGDVIDIQPGIGYYATFLYGEYGITDRLTGTIYFPFVARSILNNLQKRNGDFVPGDKLTTIGDTDVSLKYGLITEGSIVLSAKLTLGLPVGKAQGGATQTLQTGDGEFNQMISLDVSKSFYPAPVYASAYLGFNKRSNNFSDEIRFGIEAGVTLNKLTLLARINSIQSLFNGNPNPNQAQGVFGNNIEYVTFSPEVIYSFNEQWGISASVGTAFAGRQVLADPAYSGGIFLKL